MEKLKKSNWKFLKFRIVESVTHVVQQLHHKKLFFLMYSIKDSINPSKTTFSPLIMCITKKTPQGTKELLRQREQQHQSITLEIFRKNKKKRTEKLFPYSCGNDSRGIEISNSVLMVLIVKLKKKT